MSSSPFPPSRTHRGWRRLLASYLLLSTVSAATAFVFLTPGVKRVWTSSPQFDLFFSNSTPGLQDGANNFKEVSIDALTQWNLFINDIQITSNSNPSGSPASPDGKNSMHFASTVFGSSFGGSTLAVTRTFFSGNQLLEADIVFNTAFTWNSYRGNNQFTPVDFRRVAIHELGHAIGLNHPDNVGGQNVPAIMNAFISDIDNVVTDDINGGQALYGIGTGGAPQLGSAVKGDFDGNGTVDLLVRKGKNLSALCMTNGHFLNRRRIFPPLENTAMRAGAAAVFTTNKYTDLVVQSGKNIRVRLMLANSRRQEVDILALTSGKFLLVGAGDLNGDGVPDVLLQNGKSIYASFGNTNFVFTTPPTLVTSNALGAVVAVADLDTNGIADIVQQKGKVLSQTLLDNTTHVISSTTLATFLKGTLKVKGSADFVSGGAPELLAQQGLFLGFMTPGSTTLTAVYTNIGRANFGSLIGPK